MKKFSLLVSSAVVSLGMLANANAATQNSGGMFEVNLPNFQQNSFKVNVQGMYFQPSFGSSNYAIVTSTADMLFDNVPDWHFGWGVGAAWYIAGTSNDVAVNYTNYTTSNDTVTAVDAGTTHGLSVTTQGNIYDVSLGQNLNVGKNLNARLFVGGRFANLRAVQDMSNLSVSHNADSLSSILNVGGPRVGLEGTYFLGAGFGITASADAAVLIGSSKTKYSSVEAGPTNSVSDIDLGNQTVTIPNFGLKLGVNYTYQDPAYAITGELGYRADSFSNVVKPIDKTAPGVQMPASGSLMFQGPYAQVSVVF